MSRGTFRSKNKVGETMSFQTDSSSGTTFDPSVTFLPGLSDRVSWDLGEGGGYVANNNFFHTYPDGTTKTVTLRTNKLSNIYRLAAPGDGIIGRVDLSGWDNLSSLSLGVGVGNPNLTGITHTASNTVFTNYEVDNCDITGNHDMSMFPNFGGPFNIRNNPNLTGITHTASPQVITAYRMDSCDITGNHDMSMFPNLGGSFYGDDNPNLLSVTHTASTQNITIYHLDDCDITGNHDMSMFPNLGGQFIIQINPNLTGITHTTSPLVFSAYWVSNCDITGNHDISMFPNLGGSFIINYNSNLTGITHTASTQNISYSVTNSNLTGNHDMSMFSNLTSFNTRFNPNLTGVTHGVSTQNITTYRMDSCDITGNHDMSMFPNLGGSFIMYNNQNLTSCTHTASTQTFTNYQLWTCDVTGNHDMSMFPNLGGFFRMNTNSNLTGITHTSSTQTFTSYIVYDCDLTGTHDISMLTSLGGTSTSGGLLLRGNPNLTDVSLPLTTETFENDNTSLESAIDISGCDLNYVNFLPLSGVTMGVNSTYGSSIILNNNNMLVADVNHMLVDFNNLSSNLNPQGWTGVTLDISGSNASPDSTSGGYDGIAAISSLTGITNDWTIITS